MYDVEQQCIAAESQEGSHAQCEGLEKRRCASLKKACAQMYLNDRGEKKQECSAASEVVSCSGPRLGVRLDSGRLDLSLFLSDLVHHEFVMPYERCANECSHVDASNCDADGAEARSRMQAAGGRRSHDRGASARGHRMSSARAHAAQLQRRL
jgi:hypothetical protein